MNYKYFSEKPLQNINIMISLYLNIIYLYHTQKKGKDAMRKKILGLLAALMLTIPIPVLPVAAAEMSEANTVNKTFTDIDGGEISTQGGGKPKLLIFFKTDCGHCQSTLQSIAGSAWSKTGEIEICAIEVETSHSEDMVRTFQNSYCSGSAIKFAWGGNTGGFTAANTYYVMAGNANTNTIPTPTIAMIDVNNKVRQVTTGAISASTIEAFLPTLAASGNDSQNPGQDKTDAESGKDEADKPSTDKKDKPSSTSTKKKDTKKSSDDAKESDKKTDKETEIKVVCDHVWQTVVISGETATTDAVSVDQCTKCGAVVNYEAVPNSAFSAFLKETAKTILDAKQPEVVIDTQIWTGFNKTVFDAIKSRPDVSVTVNFKYKGEPYTVRIPAGTDVNLLMDENGFGGFLYINKVVNTPK